MADATQTFTVAKCCDDKDKKPEQVIPEKASKNLVWTNGRQTINYAATGECLPIKQDDGALIGHMFELSYVTDQEDKTDRPVTFLWNGGPGGASMMVNIGGMGPIACRRTGSIICRARARRWTILTRCFLPPTWCSSTRSALGTR